MRIYYGNIQRYNNLAWEDYLQLKGYYSHSFLKNEVGGFAKDITETEKMRFGSLVDDLLTDPTNVDIANAERYQEAKVAASKIKERFGSLIKTADKQVTFTASAEWNGLAMPVKGRLDFLLPGMVVDLKVTAVKKAQLSNLIDHFGYANQLWHYCRLAQVDKGYLIMYSIADHDLIVRQLHVKGDSPFWRDKILKFGTSNEGVRV